MIAPHQPLPAAGFTNGELVLSNGMRYPLVSPMVLGRDASSCDVVLQNDNRVSRTHARLEQAGGNWQITDLGSSNGTSVNGMIIRAPTIIYPGDQITIGQTSIMLEFPGIAQKNLPIPAPQPMAPQPVSPNPPLVPQIAGLPSPPGGWQQWKREPVVEGYVRYISERYMVKKDDLWKKGCAAAALGFFIAPFLVFLPFLTGSDMPARDIRVEDRHTGRVVDVKVLGELMGSINLGDAVAIWGRTRKGLLTMITAYNYETGTNIRVKKV